MIEAEVLMGSESPTLIARLEEALLGALMNGGSLPPNHGLTSTSFSDFRCRLVFNAITELIHRAFEHDLVAVEMQLKKDGTLDKVGAAHLSDMLLTKTGNGAQYVSELGCIPTYVRLIKEAAMERRMRELKK